MSAAFLQIIAYAFYIRTFLKASSRPNAASWFMFAYGTGLLVFLEAINGASWPILALPATCATMSIVVALLCLRRDATDSIDQFEKYVFCADILLTICYLLVALGLGRSVTMSTAFLIAGNVTTLTAFVPIIRSTWKNPARETPLPWVIWACAYFMLFVATVWSDQGSNPALLIYPTISVLLHASVAVLALTFRQTHRQYTDSSKAIYISQSMIAGKGMFAGRAFEQGAALCLLRGPEMRGPISSQHGPNWIGIGRDMWIDPELPLDHINHSCTPNAAFGPHNILAALQPIARNDEITVDYSTTEADPDWQMICRCGSPNCRTDLRAIQISFADAATPPPASPMMQRVWEESRSASAMPQLAIRSSPEPNVLPAIPVLRTPPASDAWRGPTAPRKTQRVPKTLPSERVG
jgi:hypothetical protein